MTVKKVINYSAFNSKGDKLESNFSLSLQVAENGGNYLVHKDILRHSRNLQQGTKSTKTRSQVRGGGRKPWRQKGTGRARAGSNRSPLWKGGGVIFGPKPKQVSLKINKKERKLALQTLFYNKRNKILLIDELETVINSPKTKNFQNICKNFNIDLNKKIVVIVAEKTIPLKLAIRNLKNLELISASHLNTICLLKAEHILLTTSALVEIKKNYTNNE